jgi:hypothetical protein
VKFTTFEKAVEMIYKTLGKPKDSYSALTQTSISFLGGYIAGIGSATASHPAGRTTLPFEKTVSADFSTRCYGVEIEQ